MRNYFFNTKEEQKNIDKVKFVFKIVAWILVAFVMFSGCSQINKMLHLPNDNPIEQEVEDIIERESGFSIDLTPEMRQDNFLKMKWVDD